jgi:hypothetical protein
MYLQKNTFTFMSHHNQKTKDTLKVVNQKFFSKLNLKKLNLFN